VVLAMMTERFYDLLVLVVLAASLTSDKPYFIGNATTRGRR
jgi:hypothetical protein